MNSQLKVTYDTMGSSSYLAVAFPKEEPVVRYQLEMIVSNEISHLLAAARRQLNGETVVYYNISSKLRLSQLLERRRLKREEFMSLAFGALKAMEEGGEYQLSETGFVMEPEYIYIEPDTCSPSFLYIPTGQPAGEGIREFLLDLIVHGKIEMSSDNLIQALLEVLNSQPVSLKDIAACLERYRTGGKMGTAEGAGRPGPREVEAASARPEGNWGQPEKNWMQPERTPAPEVPSFTAARPAPPPAGTGEGYLGAAPGPDTGERGQAPGKKPGFGRLPEGRGKKKAPAAPAKKEKESQPEEDTGFDREKAKKKFLLPQAAVMVALAAMASFGLFTDAQGGLVINNLLAVLLLVGVGEVILYREIYVNGPKAKKGGRKEKESKGGKGAKKASSKGRVPAPKPGTLPGDKGKRPAPPLPPKGPMPEVKEKAAGTPVPQPAEIKIPLAETPPFLGGLGSGPEETVPKPFKEPFPGPFPGQGQEASYGGETELWDAQEGEAWLEYYENGLMSRVPLDRESTLVGRLSGQVDFAVANPKVGKIHAEFINQNGRIYVRDQNSKNGTYLNRSGQRINSNVPYELKDRDIICLADSEFVLHCPQR